MIFTSTRSSPTRAQAGWASRAILTIFGLLFVGAGLTFCGTAVRTAWQEGDERSWSTVPCTILSSDIGDDGRSDRKYLWVVRYAYVYNGARYTCTRYARDYTGSGDYADAQRLQLQYPVNSQATCFVNPSQPGDAVMRHRGYAYLLTIPFGLAFAGFGLLPLLGAWWAGPRRSSGNPRPAAISQRGSAARKGPALLFLAFALIGGLVLWFAFLRPLWHSRMAIASWRQTPCTIVWGRVASHRGSKSTSYSPDILYRYVVDGREYRSNQYSFFPSPGGYDASANIVNRFPRGFQTRCYVSPRDPTQAVLQPQDLTTLWIVVIPGVFLIIGVLGLAGTATGRVPGRPARSPVSANRKRGRSADPSRSLTLRARTRRATGLLVLLGISLFWNGIVSVFAYEAYRQWRHGSWPFLALFLVPFALVGLLLVVATAHSVLALFNPRVTLTLSRGVIETGGSADLQWSFDGRYDRIARLTIRLEGREEATFRRGTDVQTDKSMFAAVDLVDTDRSGEIRSGRTRLELPAGSAPSFHAAHNKILWVLVVHGEIPRWPDVKEEFEIDVIPPSAPAPAPLAPGVAAGEETDSPLAISIEGGRTAFAPSETARGTAFWNLDAPPRSVELRLFCFTRGKGTTDVQVVDRVSIDHPAADGSRAFLFRLPGQPPSFSGKLVSLVWAIELIVEPGNQSCRTELIVAPGGKEIQL